MKKTFLILLIIVIIIVLTGCNKKEEKEEKEEGNKVIENSNSVVLYFSVTGNTEEVAKKIANITNSDIIKIIPEEEYTSLDLDYNDDNSRANKEQNDSQARPKIKNEINVDKYDTIYLGYPIWWGTNPKIILTLLDSYDLTGKIIMLFCTSGGSDIETSVNEIRKYNSDLTIKKGKRFLLSVTDDEIKNWINNN